MSDRSAERVARNDATFREANEHIAERADAYGVDGLIPFICECAEETCTEIVRLTPDEYAHVRSDGAHFLNAHGHVVAAQGHARVVEEHERYTIEEKVGRAGEITRKLDPRKP
ncbi:MAG: hypothetical protein QOG81_1121 [Gaiellaceae bacterium]|jgi:hypothetical protein|nr:hypothetical protein [Gaiellaceae bacterium]